MAITNAVRWTPKKEDEVRLSPPVKSQPVFMPALKQAVKEHFVTPTKNYLDRTILAGETLASIPLQALGINYGPSRNRIARLQGEGLLSTEGTINKEQLWKNATTTTKTMANVLSLANPATAVKMGVGGLAVSPAFTTGAKLLFDKQLPTRDELVKSSAEGLVRGVAYSGVNNLTKQLTNNILSKIPKLKVLTDASIKVGQPQLTDSASSWVNKWLETGGKKIIRAGAEAIIETPIWATITKEEKESYVDAMAREIQENLIVNLGGVAIEQGMDLTPAIKQSISTVASKYKDLPIEKKMGGYIKPDEFSLKNLTIDKDGSSYLLSEFQTKSGLDQTQLKKLTDTGGLETNKYTITYDGKMVDIFPKQAPVVRADKATASIVESKQEAKAESEVAKQIRSQYSGESIKLINRSKKLFSSKQFQEGDIESIRKSWRGELVDKAIEVVQENNPQITTEAEAIDFILNFPTIKQTVTPRIKLSPDQVKQKVEALRQQQEWDKTMGGPPKKQSFESLDKEADQAMFAETNAEPFEIKGTTKDGAYKQSKQAFDLFNRELDSAFGDTKVPKKAISFLGADESLKLIDLIPTLKDKAFSSLQQTTRALRSAGGSSEGKSWMDRNLNQPLLKAGVDFARELSAYANLINKTFEGIVAGDPVDSAIMRFGEKYGATIATDRQAQQLLLQQLSEAGLANKFKQAVNAIVVSRKVYDQVIDSVNASLVKNGSTPIPKLSNYFTHITKMTDVNGELYPILKNLPIEMAGINFSTRPGKSFFEGALKREGDTVEVMSALAGFKRYLPSALKLKHYIEPIQRMRATAQLLQDFVPLKAKGKLDNTHLSNFVKWLTLRANQIAGKNEGLFKLIEASSNRPFATLVSKTDQAIGKNLILFNISAGLSNMASLATALAKDPISFSKASFETLYYLTTGKDPRKIGGLDSDFLSSRLIEQVKTNTPYEKITEDLGMALFDFTDKISSQIVIRTYMDNLVKKGMTQQQALKQADIETGLVMGNRSIGMPPLVLSQLPIFTKFALEPLNIFAHYLSDIPEENQGAWLKTGFDLTKIMLANYVINNLFQAVVGRRILPDPINLAQRSVEIWEDETKDPTTRAALVLAETAKEIPVAQNFVGGGRTPLMAGIPTYAQAIDNPIASLLKLSFYFNPFGGSAQLQKFSTGYKDYSQGFSKTASGQVKYPIDRNVGNFLKIPFGAYSFEESQRYYDLGLKPASNTTSQQIKLSMDDNPELAKSLWTEEQLKRRYNKSDTALSAFEANMEMTLLDPNISDKKKERIKKDYSKFYSKMKDWWASDFVKFAKKLGIEIELPIIDSPDSQPTTIPTIPFTVDPSLSSEATGVGSRVSGRSRGKLKTTPLKVPRMKVASGKTRYSAGLFGTNKFPAPQLKTPVIRRGVYLNTRPSPKVSIRRPSIRGLSVT